MQGRTAIVLSLGMLLEKVDTSRFIGKLLKKAKEEKSLPLRRVTKAGIFSVGEF